MGAPVRRSAKPPQKFFFDIFRHFQKNMSLFGLLDTYREWKGPPRNAQCCQRSRRSTTKYTKEGCRSGSFFSTFFDKISGTG